MRHSYTRVAAIATTVLIAGGIALSAAVPASADTAGETYVTSIADSETSANYNTWHLSSDPTQSAASVDGAGAELRPGTKGTTVIKGLDTHLTKTDFEALLAKGISWTSTSGHANFQLPILANGTTFATIVPMAGVVTGVNVVGDNQQWAFSKPIGSIPAWENHSLSDLLTAAGDYIVIGYGIQADPGNDATVTSIKWGDQVVRFWNPAVNRIAGSDRYDTSAQVAQAAFPTTAPVVFIASGIGFADALSAAAPAAKLGGPLLITAPGSLPNSIKTEITNLHPSTIYIVGGTGAVSDTVAQQLQPLATTVTRLAGTDRFDTARKVIAVAFPSLQKVYVAGGFNFPDALSASAAAGAAGIPVLLVNGTKTSLDPATTSFLADRGADAFTVIGGAGVMSSGIAGQLTDLGPVKRINGADRYATSRLLNADAFTSNTSAYVASGVEFPDALSGAVLAAVHGAPLYLVSPALCSRRFEARPRHPWRRQRHTDRWHRRTQRRGRRTAGLLSDPLDEMQGPSGSTAGAQRPSLYPKERHAVRTR